jgi:DNA-binding NarL/FixJ family response regulator
MRNDISSTRPRVLLADDHPGIIAVIRRLLAHEYDVVGSVENGAQLLVEAARLLPDVIVVDLDMPIMSGLDACRELTRTMPRIRLIVLTVETDASVRHVALSAGAFAFINKQTAGIDLLPALSSACGGQRM